MDMETQVGTVGTDGDWNLLNTSILSIAYEERWRSPHRTHPEESVAGERAGTTRSGFPPRSPSEPLQARWRPGEYSQSVSDDRLMEAICRAIRTGSLERHAYDDDADLARLKDEAMNVVRSIWRPR
jgi:hypothetical protein